MKSDKTSFGNQNKFVNRPHNLGMTTTRIMKEMKNNEARSQLVEDEYKLELNVKRTTIEKHDNQTPSNIRQISFNSARKKDISRLEAVELDYF